MPIPPQAGIWTEICEIWRGLGEYMEDGWNVLDILGLAVSLGGFGVRCFDPTCPWGRSLYALSAPLLVSRILFFAQVLPFQGPMVQASMYGMRPAPCLPICFGHDAVPGHCENTQINLSDLPICE